MPYRLCPTVLKLIPKSVLRRLPPPDPRRDAAWGMCAVGVFMIFLGRFALFSGMDTKFTATLARMSMEHAWGAVMIASGAVQAIAAFTPWRSFQVPVYGVSSIVLLWTWAMAGLIGGLSTPTVDACLGVGIVMLLGTVSKAQQSVLVREREKKHGEPEYG